MRLSREQLEVIKSKLGVDRIWSFSKMSTFEQCTWSYKLKYLDKLRGKDDSCYTYWGTIAHDIRQGFYDGEYKSNEEMLEKLEEEIAKWTIEEKKGLQFPNKGEHISYFDNLRHYFASCKNLEVDVQNERVVISVLEDDKGEKFAFQGYIDSYFVQDDKHYILDYKTSSASGFTGAKLMDKSQQLMIYAYGLWKMQGIPINDIVLRFDMMKYLNVSFVQKNGSVKTTRCERKAWVTQMANNIRKDFEGVTKDIELIDKKVAQLVKKSQAKCRTELEIEGLNAEIAVLNERIEGLKGLECDVFKINEMISQAIDDNSLNCLPKFVQDKYKVEECLIDIEVDEDIINEFMDNIVKTLKSIVGAEEHGSPEDAFSRSRIDDKESYFCNHLCDVKGSCTFYKEYREHLNVIIGKDDDGSSDDAILAMLGL